MATALPSKKQIAEWLEVIRGEGYDLNLFRRKLTHSLPKEAFRQDGKLYAIWETTIKEYVTDIKHLIGYRKGEKLTVATLNNL